MVKACKKLSEEDGEAESYHSCNFNYFCVLIFSPAMIH